MFRIKIFTFSMLIILQSWVTRSNTSSIATTHRSEQSLEEMIHETCLQKSGFRPLDNNDTLLRVVEVPQASTVSLACTFCGESTEDLPRVWYRRLRKINSSVEEVAFDLGPNLNENKLATFPNHTLIIQNVSLNDGGIYFCKGPDEDEATDFRFSVDIVETDVPIVEENQKPFVTFEKYNEEVILRSNEKLYQNNQLELDGVLDMVKVKIVSEWDPWLPCDGCSSIRRRYAKCRLHTWLNRVKYPDIVDDNLNNVQKLLHQSSIISCHSKDLSVWFPFLYSLTSSIPNFLQVQKCFDSCTPKDRLAHEPKYQMSVRLDLGSSMSFACPESDLKSKVVWKRDGAAMKPVGVRKKKGKKKKMPIYKMAFSKKTEELQLERAFVDRMNVLQLCSVTYRESGFYVCYVDSVLMKSYNISIVTAEETQRERYYHFLLLSFYTSLISTTIVSIGVGWAFLNRDQFIKIEVD